MKRSMAREQAFTLVFERSFRDDSFEDIIRDAVDGRLLEIDDFARSLAENVWNHLDEIDSIISKYSDKWKINRLPKVTLAILRLSLCEIDYFEDIPAPATINEAVELAKKFSTTDDSAYINGVLGAYLRDKESVGE